MLKPCKIVTRGGAVGLFFAALSTWSMQTQHAWYDAMRASGERIVSGRYSHNGRLGSQRHFEHVTAEQAALYVRTVGVDRIAEQLASQSCSRTWQGVDLVRPYTLPDEALDVRGTLSVLADKLLSLGHWLGEPLALWVNRPKGASRAKWQRAAALKFVQALPVPPDVYALRHEPSSAPPTLGDSWGLPAFVARMLPNGTRDALLLARTIEDAMQEKLGRTCVFTLHAQSDTEWLVRVGSGYTSNVFRLQAPPDDRVAFTNDEQLTPKQRCTGWTHFWDMHSGGSEKTDYAHIFVELPESEAIAWFEKRFDQDPNDVACECCGSNFSISESDSLEQLTGYHRNCDTDKQTHRYVERPRYSDASLVDIATFCARKDVLVVRRESP